MNPEELEKLCDLTVKLTELKLEKCGHLAIDNFSIECLGKLLDEFKRPRIKRYGDTSGDVL